MDPIKVDFTKKDRDNKPMMIPPERAGLRLLISVVLTLLTAVVAYYLMYPALNIKSIELYMYLGLVVVSFPIFLLIVSGALGRPEYLPYEKKHIKVKKFYIRLTTRFFLTIIYTVRTKHSRDMLP